MGLNWSLKEIYASFTCDEFIGDLEKLTVTIEGINVWATEIVKDKENVVEKLEEYIKRFSDFSELFYKLGAFAELTVSADTSNLEGLKYSDIIENKSTKIVEATTKLDKWISTIENIDLVIEKSEILKEHEFVIKNTVNLSKYLLSDREENIIANMQNTGSSAFGKLKDKLISSLKVEFEEDGEIKELPLTVILNKAYDEDADVRKRAYEAEIASYKKVEEGLAAALNGIKGEVLTVCDFRGYKSPLQKTLVESRMDEESLEAMLSAMRESMPVFRKYLRRKAEILGHKNGLPFYDMYAPISGVDMKYTYEDGAKFVEKNFRTFSNNLGDYAAKAIKNNWIDVMPKEGKVGGAFCANLHFIGESRILLNYGDSFEDVITMAHELGHGFHGECLKNETVLNSDYPMPIAETASTFCETIIKKAAVKEATKEEALAILETEISGCTQVIVDIYSRFLFEKSLFEARKECA
ncbi:MAG: M3 family oligoendopeptidase, partial [Clostridium sp.]